jgi:hypothetical protein
LNGVELDAEHSQLGYLATLNLLDDWKKGRSCEAEMIVGILLGDW